jgi:hypothetical protein
LGFGVAGTTPSTLVVVGFSVVEEARAAMFSRTSVCDQAKRYLDICFGEVGEVMSSM